MRAVTLGVLALTCACAPETGSDSLRVASHARTDYTWTASSCRSAGGIFGHECEDELVEIDSVEVDDERVVHVGDVFDTSLELQTERPGQTLVILLGGDDDVMHLEVEVVAPTVQLVDPFAPFIEAEQVLLLPGATARVAYVLADDGGTPLRGIADAIEIEAQGMAGVVVEPVLGDNAVLLHVPDKVGAFELVPMERGEALPVEVVDVAAVDGVELGGFDVAAQVRQVVPTVGGVALRAGEMAYTIEPADPAATCIVHAPDWGRMDPVEAATVRSPIPVWGVEVEDGPCDLRVQLPDAAGGEGLDVVVAWTS